MKSQTNEKTTGDVNITKSKTNFNLNSKLRLSNVLHQPKVYYERRQPRKRILNKQRSRNHQSKENRGGDIIGTEELTIN